MAIDTDGHVWVLDTRNSRVEEFGETGDFIPKSGTCTNLAAATGASYAPGWEDVGSKLRADVTASNSAGEASASAETEAVEEGGEPPGALILPSISGSAQAGQMLTANPGSWIGSEPISYAYQWQSCDWMGVDCEEIPGATGATYTLREDELGKTVYVVVTATNALGSSSASSEPSAVVRGAPPSNTAPPAISGTAQQGQTLSASTGTWTSSSTPSYTYQWQRCDMSEEGCTPIEGATNASYQIGEADVGATIRVRVTATNPAGSSSVRSPATEPVAASGEPAPANTAPPTISGAAQEGQTLSASSGAWSGGEPISYAYQWQACDEAGGECEDVEGATGAEYIPGTQDQESRLRVLVTASGPGGSAQARSAASAVVQAGAPSELQGPSVAGDPVADQPLDAQAGEWEGGEVQLVYQWQGCNAEGQECADISGATEPQYVPSEGDVGRTLRLRVGASDDAGSVTALSSPVGPVEAASALLNTLAPSISGEAQSGKTLTAEAGSWLGAEAVSYTYQWQSCNVYGSGCEAIEGATSPTYIVEPALAGRTLRVAVAVAAAGEAEGDGGQVSLPTQPVAAEGAPVPQDAPGISGTGLTGYTLTATIPALSGEAPTSETLQWERCAEDGTACTAITGASGGDYTLTAADAGSALRLLVSATNSHGAGEAISPPIIVGAATPANVSVPSTAGSYEPYRALRGDPGIWTGIGTIAFSYQWRRCPTTGECETITAAGERSYTPTSVDEGHALQLLVTATDADGSASASSPHTPAIGSEAASPESTSPPSLEGTPTVGNTLSASAGVWSGSEPISYAYQWQRCDAGGDACTDVAGATSAAYTLAGADAGARLRVLVQASNAVASASASSSPSEVVGDAGPPANTAAPAIGGEAGEGQRLFAENGEWSGSLPLSYYYRWERCNAAGEACTDVEGATQPTHTLTAADVGHTLRLEVTTTNSLGSAGALSPQTAVVSPAGEASTSPAVESIERYDPSLLAPSSTAEIEEQPLTPAIEDAGEQLSPQGTLTSSTISKVTPGELAVNTADGELSLTPTATSANAATTPTIVNGAAALFAETWRDSDTIVRPSALGAITLLHLRSAEAPASFSWQVDLGEDQQLEALPDGSVAVTELTSIEGPPGEEGGFGAGGPSEAPPQSGGEGRGAGAAEEERGSLVEEGGLTPLPPAPTLTTSETTPREGEPHPQDTQTVYERDTRALEYAETHQASVPLMLIEAPTVLDAAGEPVPASLGVSGDTVTLTLTPGAGAAYPLSAEVATVAPTDLVSTARDPTHYGLSEHDPHVFETLNSKLEGPPLHIGVARDIVPYSVWSETQPKEELLRWLKAVSGDGLAPYITLEAGYGGLDRCDDPSDCPEINREDYKHDVEAVMGALVNGIPSEGIRPVRKWGAMNEPDQRESNPLYGNATEAAELWDIANSVAEGLHCGTCQVVAGEFTSYSSYVGKYREAILTLHKRGVPLPRVWGLHDYYDLEHYTQHSEAGEGNTEVTKFVNAINGALGKPRIWLSEQGVKLREKSGEKTVLARGMRSRNGKPISAERLQREAADDFLKLANGHSRVELVDYYQYLGPTLHQIEHEEGFDSALVAGEGVAAAEKQPERPTYCVLVLDKHGGCPPSSKTGRTSAVTATAATASALVNPEGQPTTYSFEYGPTNTYGHGTPASELPNETGEQTASANLSGLETCATYHYQALAENESDEEGPSPGGDKTFLSGGCHIVSLSGGGLSGCGAVSTGKVICWGNNLGGELGNGGEGTQSTTPVLVDGITNATAVGTGEYTSCALLASGRIDCWGGSTWGQLGDGSEESSSTPVEVSGIASAVALGVGDYSACAVLADGHVECWGDGKEDQLGDGSEESSSTPVEVSGIADARSVAVGAWAACAVLEDGGVKCWGWGVFGELGDGSKESSSTPVKVTGITDASEVTVGGDAYACARLSSGEVDCWGRETGNAYAPGEQWWSTTPVRVSGISGATSVIAEGEDHTCVVLSSGGMRCWGADNNGQLGDGSFSYSETPVAVSGLGGSAEAAGGGLNFSCALLSSQGVECWGANSFGDIGDGRERSSLKPMAVVSTE